MYVRIYCGGGGWGVVYIIGFILGHMLDNVVFFYTKFISGAY